MAFKRYANALIAKPGVQFDQWMDGIRAQHEGAVPKDYVGRIAKALLRKCDPGKYLLSHATIVASVDTYTPKGLKTGRKLQNGIQIDVKFPDIRIKPECHKIINNNGDAWSRPLLLSTYRTFIGAHNYLEHIQLPELSKGFIVDAVARDLGETVYVDILVATDRKHNLLIGDILGGKVNALSMGCFFPGTRITLEDGSVIPIEEIRPNMMVLSQKGNVCLVKNLQIRQNRWSMRRIKVSGLPIVESTYNHNFYVVPRKELTYIKKNGRNLLNHDDYRFEKLEAGSIQINDVVATPIPNTIVEPKISIKEARLLGLWVGDGWKWQNKHDSSTGIGIVCDSKYPEIIEDIISSINQISWKAGETRITSDGGSICKTEFFNAMNNYDGSFTNLCKESNISRRTGYNWVNGYKKLGRVVDKRNESKQVLRSQRRGADYLISSSRTVRNLIDSYVFGNKALNKLLSSDIVSWPIDHQLAFISGVIDSDGCVSTTKRGTKQVFISTRNENLACQYMSILLRCGIVSTLSVVKRNGTKLLPNSGGIDYQIRLRNDGVKKIPSLKIKSHLDSIKYTPGNSDRWISGGYLFSRVKKIDEFEYDGFVYDMEVDGDHSYIANGVGVSNCISLFTVCTKCGNVAADDSQLCSCVQYEGKGSQFIDDSGVQHPIAELVGHVSVPNSNQFIEASWVRSPAFRGAVRRNLLNPDVEILASKLHDAVSIFELRKDFMKSDGIKKAASMIKKAQDPEDKPADEPPEDGPAEDKPEDADASMDSILEGGDTEDKPADDKSDDDKPADEPEIPVDKMKELLEKAQEMLLESIVKGLDKQLKPNSEDVGTIVPPSKPVPAGGVEDSLDNVVRSSQEFNRRLNKVFKNNSKLIKWASWAYKVVHEGGPKAIIATEMNPRDLIILSWIEDTVRSHNYSSDLYKIAIDIGSIDGYPSETSYLTACRVKLGRVLTPEEQQFFRWKGRIASLSKF